MPPRQRSSLLQDLAASPPLVAAERVARPDAALARALDAAQIDRARLIVELYEARRIPEDSRRAQGVYYTPREIIHVMLEHLPARGEWLDPSAGAGAFLIEIVRRQGRGVLSRLHACDIDSLALDAAALALEALLGAEASREIAAWRRERAHCLDFLRDAWPGKRPDVIVGNPPYGHSDDDDLPRLFPDLRGEIDLYSCFLLRAVAAVRTGGIVSLLVPDTWLTNKQAATLRAALAGHGLARVVDFGKPFATAKDTRVHAVSLRAGTDSCAVESLRGGSRLTMAPTSAGKLHAQAPQGWRLYRTAGEVAACDVMEGSPRLESQFEVFYGLRTGDNARHVAAGSGKVPLIAGRDFDAFDRHLTPRHLRDPLPFQSALRRQQGRWKIGIQRIRTNSQQPWRRWVEAALLNPDEVGLDSLTLIAEPHAGAVREEPSAALLGLLGVLNSAILNRWYRLTFTDVNVKPVYVASLPVPAIDVHLSSLVRQRLASSDNRPLERAIDRLVATAYGLSDDQLESLEVEFWGAARPPLPSLDEAVRGACTEDSPLRRKGG